MDDEVSASFHSETMLKFRIKIISTKLLKYIDYVKNVLYIDTNGVIVGVFTHCFLQYLLFCNQ